MKLTLRCQLKIICGAFCFRRTNIWGSAVSYIQCYCFVALVPVYCWSLYRASVFWHGMFVSLSVRPSDCLTCFLLLFLNGCTVYLSPNSFRRRVETTSVRFSSIYFITIVLQHTVWITYTRQIENRQVPCSLHRGHNFALPTIHLEFNKRHFVARVLFDYVWCVSHVCSIILS